MQEIRCLEIETRSSDSDQLDVRIVSRLNPKSGALDYVLVFVVVISLVAAVLVATSLLFESLMEGWGGWLLWATGWLLVMFSPLGVPFLRKLRLRSAKKSHLEVSLEPGSLRGHPELRIGDETIPTAELEAVALLGWQEKSATDRLWDVTLLKKGEGSIDVLLGDAQDVRARDFAQALATALNLELRESSATGGAVNPVTFRDPKGLPRVG